MTINIWAILMPFIVIIICGLTGACVELYNRTKRLEREDERLHEQIDSLQKWAVKVREWSKQEHLRPPTIQPPEIEHPVKVLIPRTQQSRADLIPDDDNIDGNLRF